MAQLVPCLLNKNYQEVLNTNGPTGSIGGNFGFDPRSIPGCVLWLDSKNTSNLVGLSGTDFTSWNDLSVNSAGDLTNAESIYDSDSKMLSFPGTGHLFASVIGVSDLTKYDFAVFALVNLPNTTPSGNDYILSKGSTSDTTCWTLYYTSSRTIVFTYKTTVGTVTKTSTAQTNGSLLLISIVAPRNVSAGTLMYINGTVNGAGVTGKTGDLTTSTLLRIGSDGSGLNNWTGQIGEILVYCDYINSGTFTYIGSTAVIKMGSITTTQRQHIEGYLAWKWGVTLPTAHPYYKAITTLPGPTKPFLRPFLPWDIDNCVLWLDGADPSTIYNSGDAGFAWDNKANPGDQATALSNTNTGITYYYNATDRSACGVYLNNGNGGNILSNSAILKTTIPATVLYNVYETAFIVFTPSKFNGSSENPGSNKTYLFGTSLYPTGYSGRFMYLSNTSYSTTTTSLSNLRLQLASADAVKTIGSGTQAISLGNTHILSFSISYGHGSLYVNGNNKDLNTNGGHTSDGSPVTLIGSNYPRGSGSGTTYYGRYVGYIHEVIIYRSSTDILTTQREQVEGYLAWKWGSIPLPTLSPSLPSTHSFRKFPPATVVPYPIPGTY